MTSTTPAAAPASCYWCKDTAQSHRHYTVLCYENGKYLGPLGSDGYTVNRKIHAVILSKARAAQIAAEINSAGEFTTKASPF